jgi:hypothetical protein
MLAAAPGNRLGFLSRRDVQPANNPSVQVLRPEPFQPAEISVRLS